MRTFLLLIGLSLGTALAAPVSFNDKILPILSDRCFACHGPDSASRKADLRLDREEDAKTALKSMPVMIDRITSTDPDEVMPPPEAKLSVSPQEIGLLKQWIAEGAHWEKHWAFIPPKKPNRSADAVPSWGKNDIDTFILARLQAEGLKPSPPASREHLLRRLSFDLTGLPPTLAEMDAFLADDSEDAIKLAIDRLLESPAFGERLALEWLDVARYGDTDGLFEDHPRTIYPWRDWVVSAFNANLPYDDFITWQVAGDLLDQPTREQKLATGFLRNNPTSNEGGIIDEDYRIKYLIDRVNTTSTAFLGLTMECAQCHDHKFDPMTQREYYQFGGFFNSLVGRGNTKGATDPIIRLLSPEDERRLPELAKEIPEAETALKETPPELLADFEKSEPADAKEEERDKRLAKFRNEWPGFKAARAHLEALKKEKAAIESGNPLSMIAQDQPEPRETFVLMRGEYDKPGEKVRPAAPASIMPYPTALPRNRRGLATWITDPANPLTARVAVNRYWQMFFGQGLVKTSEDFGTQGDRPSHQALLDYLAVSFIDSGWDLKGLIRLIVSSATYQQVSVQSASLAERDAGNRFLARAPRLRLPAEFIRDHALSVSGLLVQQLGGPGVQPYQPGELFGRDAIGAANTKFKLGSEDELYRRSLYTYWKRQIPAANMRILGANGRNSCRTRREQTNTPLQALVLLNDPQFVEAARVFGERMLVEGGDTPEDRIRFAFRLATSRQIKGSETKVILAEYHDRLKEFQFDAEATKAFLQGGGARQPSDQFEPAELAAHAAVAALILNLDESLSKS